jgi:hypothetical protein
LINFGDSFHDFQSALVLEYKKYYGGIVYLGDESQHRIVGCGGVLIKFPNGRVNEVNGFFYILGLA